MRTGQDGQDQEGECGEQEEGAEPEKEDMQWLSSNTQFDKEHIKQWHKVIIFIEDNLAL